MQKHVNFVDLVKSFPTNIFLQILPENANKCDENVMKYLGLRGGKACKSCRYRQELSNEYFLAKFGVDAEENEPSKVCAFG